MSTVAKLILVLWPGVCGVAWAFLILHEPWTTIFLKCIAFTYIVMAPIVLLAFASDKVDARRKQGGAA